MIYAGHLLPATAGHLRQGWRIWTRKAAGRQRTGIGEIEQIGHIGELRVVDGLERAEAAEVVQAY